MKIRIIASAGYGDRQGAFHPQGSIADVDADVAQKLIIHRIAVPVLELKLETTEVAPGANAALRTTKPKPSIKPQVR